IGSLRAGLLARPHPGFGPHERRASMVKKKVSLGSSPDLADGAGGSSRETAVTAGARAAAIDVLELFFNTGIILHEVALPRGLPDVVSSFVVMKPGGEAPGGAPGGISVRRAQSGEEPDV